MVVDPNKQSEIQEKEEDQEKVEQLNNELAGQKSLEVLDDEPDAIKPSPIQLTGKAASIQQEDEQQLYQEEVV